MWSHRYRHGHTGGQERHIDAVRPELQDWCEVCRTTAGEVPKAPAVQPQHILDAQQHQEVIPLCDSVAPGSGQSAVDLGGKEGDGRVEACPARVVP